MRLASTVLRQIRRWTAKHGRGRQREILRIMYALFFDARGYLAQIPAPERASVIEQFYATQVVPEIVKHYNNASSIQSRS